MITSKLTGKAQTTIPQPVRTALGLKAGDKITYLIDGDPVRLSRTVINAKDDSLASFSEWAGEADCRAYGSL